MAKVSFSASNVANKPARNPQGFNRGEKKVISFFDPKDCPQIPENISYEEFVHYFTIPEFSDIYNIAITPTGILIHVNNGEQGNKDVKVPYRLFNPEAHSVRFPKFILSFSKYINYQFDYIDNGMYFNQNEILYIALRHRMQVFAEYNRVYTYLLNQDIQKIVNYIDYNNYSSWNAMQKSEHSYAIFDPYDANFNTSDSGLFTGNGNEDEEEENYKLAKPLGNSIGTPKFNLKNITKLFRDIDVLPASESMASESGKFVISNENIYQAAGFKMDYVFNQIKTMFPIKANIPARFKTHVVCDAYRAFNYSKPIFTEDYIEALPNHTDETIINAVCVFTPIENDGKFLCGEIECSDQFADNIVIKKEIIKGEFNKLFIKAGEFVKPKGDRYYHIGEDENDELVSLRGFESVQIISIDEIGFSNSKKIIAECKRRIGSSRIESSTGIKGVTKPRFNIGSISFNDGSGNAVNLPVDLLVGSNSIKAKANTIYLAQAALAHLHGYNNNPEEMISSMDSKLINSLRKSIGKVTYTDENGNTKEVYAGIVPVRVTEMAYMYKNLKLQSFMTQSAWYLNQNGFSDFVDLIYNTCISEEDIALISELTKIVEDSQGSFIDDLPVYSSLKMRDIFKEEDCKFDTNPLAKHTSKLLEESNKGFYIYFEHIQSYLRMPSAALIERFTSKIADGTYNYPRILSAASYIIKSLLTVDRYGSINPNNVFKFNRGDAKSQASTFGATYLELCYRMLHTNNKLLRNLMNPKVYGCSMKQMVDFRIPRNTIVIPDKNLHAKLASKTGGHYEKTGGFFAFAIRNPVIWKSQIQSVKVWTYEEFKEYLSVFSNVDIDKYMDLKYCRDLVLLNPHDAITQQSDVDGDLMPLFIPEGEEAQKYLYKFNFAKPGSNGGVNNITQEEIDWINSYKQSEFDSNSMFYELESGSYKIYSLKIKSDGTTSPSFDKYFADSIIAKGDVGIGTSNLWQFQILIDLFQLMNEDGNGKLNDKSINLSREEYDKICFAYTKLLQDLVVRGIKHVEGGSSGFTPFLLENITLGDNREFTFDVFSNKVGLGRKLTEKLFHILVWGSSNNYIKNISSFISFYNRGVGDFFDIDKEIIDYLMKTFYGSRLQLYYDIVSKTTADKKAKVLHNFNNGSSSVAGDTSKKKWAFKLNVKK